MLNQEPEFNDLMYTLATLVEEFDEDSSVKSDSDEFKKAVNVLRTHFALAPDYIEANDRDNFIQTSKIHIENMVQKFIDLSKTSEEKIKQSH